jgi:hypothetical protein
MCVGWFYHCTVSRSDIYVPAFLHLVWRFRFTRYQFFAGFLLPLVSSGQDFCSRSAIKLAATALLVSVFASVTWVLLRRFLSSLKFFLFDFRPSSAESRGLALCPASILVLKDLIFSWQDFFSADCCFCSGHTRFGFAAPWTPASSHFVLLISPCRAWSAPECGSFATGSACFSCPRVGAPPGQIARSAPDSIFHPDSLLLLRAPVRFFRCDSIFLRVVLLSASFPLQPRLCVCSRSSVLRVSASFLSGRVAQSSCVVLLHFMCWLF